MGYESPTEIQALALPHLLDSEQDMVGIASTGTGKTAAFSLPLIQKLDLDVRAPQALVLCPTRELCLQVAGEINSFTKYLKEVDVLATYGGDSIERQMRFLRKGPKIVVGTPGRTLDLIRREALDLQAVRFLVLDEADEMLSMGFRDELEAIMSNVPEERQSLLFSATMPPEIARLSKKYMDSPKEIEAGDRNVAAESVQHKYAVVRRNDRYAALKRILDFYPGIYGIVFCQTRIETQEIADRLSADGYRSEAIHGDLSQAQRSHVMRRFREKSLKLLIATDVAARGIDVQDLTHVIHFKLPDSAEAYVHRSGRTGRAGKEGVSIALLDVREPWKLRRLAERVGRPLEKMAIPSGEEVCGAQLMDYIKNVMEAENIQEEMAPFMDEIRSQLESLDRDELIQRFVSLQFGRFLALNKGARDLNPASREERQDHKKKFFHRFHLNLGSKHQLTPGQLMDLFNDLPELRGARIGKIDIQRKITFFEVEDRVSDDLSRILEGMEYRGIPVEVQRTKDRPRPFVQRRPGGHGHGGGRNGGRGGGRGGPYQRNRRNSTKKRYRR